MNTTDDTLSKLRAAAGRLVESRQSQTEADRQRITADTIALCNLRDAVKVALPYLAKTVEVAVGPRELRPINGRRAVHVYGPNLRDTVAVLVPGKDIAIYLEADGQFFEVVRHPPEVPEAALGDTVRRTWSEAITPRCSVHTNNLAPEELVTRYADAVVVITKNLNKAFVAEEPHVPA